MGFRDSKNHHWVGDHVFGGKVHRANQSFVFTNAKVGATSGWTVGAAANLWQSTLAASQTSATLVIPLSGLHVGDIITKIALVGQVESGGETVTIDAALRKLKTAAADLADSAVGSITQVVVTADTALSRLNAMSGALAEVVAADCTYYCLITGTTGSSTDIALQGVQVFISQN